MASIHKLTKDGQTIYPATTTDAVVHPDLAVSSSKLIEEVNVSKIFPTGGIDGTNKYTLETAIAMIPASLRNVGLKCSFLDEAGKLETWEYRGGAYSSANSWKQGGAGRIEELQRLGYIFAGVATPSTNPGTPGGPVFYLASEAGVYSYFDGITVLKGEFAIFLYSSNNNWEKLSANTVTLDMLYELATVNGEDLYPYKFESGYIITNKNAGEVVSLDINVNTSYKCCVIDVNEGDCIIVKGLGMNQGRLYCVLDSGNRIIDGYQASVNLNTIDNPFTLIIPENGKKVVFNIIPKENTSFVTKIKLDSIITEINKRLNVQEDLYPYKFESGYIITNKNAGEVVSLDINVNTSYKCCVIDVNEGDCIIVKGLGMNQGRLYCVLDSENRIIDGYQASVNLNTIDNPFTLIIPENGKKVVFNCLVNSENEFIKIITAIDVIEEIKNRLNGDSETYIEDVYPSKFVYGYIVTGGSVGSVVNLDVVTNQSYRNCVIDVNSGDSIVVKGLGMNLGRLYCVLDSGNRIIDGYQASVNLNTIDNPFTLIIPENGKKVVFNIIDRGGSSFLVTKKIYPDSIEELRNKVKVLEEEKDVIYRTILNNRLPQKKETDEVNILCIGNSFTQDLLGYVPNILQSLSITNVKIGTIIGGGHTIEMMYNKLLDNSTFNFTYTGESSATKTILEALKYKDWDVVVINQARLDNGIWEDIEPYLANYVGLIKANSNYHASIAYQITWAFSDKFSTDYSKIASVNYSDQTNKDYWAKFETQENQWKFIKKVGNNIINTGIDIIIPTGQAIENLRTTEYVNENYQFTRDTLHLDYGVGRFTASCTFIQSLITPILGKDIEDNTYIPVVESYIPIWDGNKYDNYACVKVTDSIKKAIYKAVKLACSNIFNTYQINTL